MITFPPVATAVTLWLAASGYGFAAVLAPPATSDELFTNEAIRHLRIEISPENLQILRRYSWQRNEPPEARPTVPCTVHDGAQTFSEVGVHLKGGFGSFRRVDAKPGLTLVFDRVNRTQSFLGLGKISLNNSVQDPTFITDKLCRELFAQAGVPVPRADYATVELNGRSLGLYVLTEGWDKRFLRRYFTNVDGNLYDPPVGTDITKPLRATSGVNKDDQAELLSVVAATRDPNLDTRMARLEQLVDLDRFLSLTALDIMLWNWDGYAMNKNNYRVFHDLEANRLVFMPHGMDQMFWRPDGPIVTGRNGCVARAVLDTPEGRRRYLERFIQLRAQVFNLPAVMRRIDDLAKRIRPAIRPAQFTPFERESSFDAAVDRLRQLIQRRARSIDEQLAAAEHRTALKLRESTLLADWKAGSPSAQVHLDQTEQPPALHITATAPGLGVWFTTVWLEEGRYRLEGRVKTRGVQAELGNDPVAGAGLRLWSNRKLSGGLDWSWFPYRESRDHLRRGEMVAPSYEAQRLAGTHDWTPIVYEIELRQPLADLEVRCELSAEAGEAWFDLQSLRLTRLTNVTP
jgi:spore coat protein H